MNVIDSLALAHLKRADKTGDWLFYAGHRIVAHIDDNVIGVIQEFFD